MSVQRVDLGDGLSLSRLVHGMWRLKDWDLSADALRALVEVCLGHGITTFDHADIYGGYGCEEIFGLALETDPSLRDRIEIVTKCGIQGVSDRRPATTIKHYDTSRDYIVTSAERSLRKLRVERLDVLLLHRPDPLMDADEVAAAFDALRTAGKVRRFGVSNFTPHQLELLASRVDPPLVTHQIEASVLHLEPFLDGTLDQAQRLRMPPMAWSPLAGGWIFGGDEERPTRVRAALHEVGRQVGAQSIDQVALAWLLRHPSRILPIVGSGRADRIESAVGACGLELDRQQWFRIWTASTGSRVP